MLLFVNLIIINSQENRLKKLKQKWTNSLSCLQFCWSQLLRLISWPRISCWTMVKTMVNLTMENITKMVPGTSMLRETKVSTLTRGSISPLFVPTTMVSTLWMETTRDTSTQLTTMLEETALGILKLTPVNTSTQDTWLQLKSARNFLKSFSSPLLLRRPRDNNERLKY